ncbi:MAG: hypothetical protein H6Q05_1109 [Acidobacteria bacterium]|jgi:hypothetical protein|nr:hypothetical protein [Acidobacteriota bacterium]
MPSADAGRIDSCIIGGELDFVRVIGKVEEFFERGKLRFAVIGAFGLHAYGLSRATYDLDFVAEQPAQAGLVPFLESLGYETLHLSAGYSNHLHPDLSMGRLDFVYVDGETSRELFGSARVMPVMEGIALAVPRAEHLAAMKIQAMKNDPERTFQEMADILFLLRLPEIDGEEIRGYFERQGMIERYHELRKLL